MLNFEHCFNFKPYKFYMLNNHHFFFPFFIISLKTFTILFLKLILLFKFQSADNVSTFIGDDVCFLIVVFNFSIIVN